MYSTFLFLPFCYVSLKCVLEHRVDLHCMRSLSTGCSGSLNIQALGAKSKLIRCAVNLTVIVIK